MVEPTLRVRGLKTHFTLDEGVLKAVDGVDIDVFPRETVGIIGESGCGKSVLAQSILRIVGRPGRVVAGKITLRESDGREIDLVAMDENGPAIRAVRGKRISMIFQEPMTSLSPVHSIGFQISEAILLHRTADKKEARERAVELLAKVGMGNPRRRYEEYPFQLSGGLRQRAMIAMALSCSPSILIADEPTTALDVTVQAQILELIESLQDEFQMSVLFITHNLGVISQIAQRTYVMYLGRVVESGTTREVFKNPQHPYTRKLLRSIPKLHARSASQLDVIRGNVPVPIGIPPMCGFCDRCDDAIAGLCNSQIPALVGDGAGHCVRCFLHNPDKEEPADERSVAEHGAR